jgi:hypothetical protein
MSEVNAAPEQRESGDPIPGNETRRIGQALRAELEAFIVELEALTECVHTLCEVRALIDATVRRDHPEPDNGA